MLNNRFSRFTFVVLSFTVVMLAAYLTVIYLYPFVIAFTISVFLHPIVSYTEDRWGLNRGMVTGIVISLFFALSITSLFLAFKRLHEDLFSLLSQLPTYLNQLLQFLQKLEENYIHPIYTNYLAILFEKEGKTFSFTELLLGKVEGNILSFIQTTVHYLSSFLSSFAFTSMMIIFIILATYFFTKDYKWIIRFIREHIPDPVTSFFIQMKKRIFSSLQALIKTQIIVAFLTMIVSLSFFLLFKIEHGFLIAIFIFFLDLIPYLGIGVLFIPWIFYIFFTENYLLTIQLSMLYIILIILRQIIEPRFLAKNLGLHPIVTLVILFISIHLFGIIGMIMTPVLLILCSSIYHTRIFNLLIQFILKGEM